MIKYLFKIKSKICKMYAVIFDFNFLKQLKYEVYKQYNFQSKTKVF